MDSVRLLLEEYRRQHSVPDNGAESGEETESVLRGYHGPGAGCDEGRCVLDQVLW